MAVAYVRIYRVAKRQQQHIYSLTYSMGQCIVNLDQVRLPHLSLYANDHTIHDVSAITTKNFVRRMLCLDMLIFLHAIVCCPFFYVDAELLIHISLGFSVYFDYFYCIVL